MQFVEVLEEFTLGSIAEDVKALLLGHCWIFSISSDKTENPKRQLESKASKKQKYYP